MIAQATKLNPMVGRLAERAELRALVREPSVSQVTITGPGGIGKTRLALDVAAERSTPVAFVSLESIRDSDLVLPAVADALGIPTRIGGDLREEIRQSLERQSWVIVLDNLEHLAGIGEQIGWLLTLDADLTIVATSRSPIHVQGERLFALGPLPPDGDGADLFIARARLADRTFSVDDRVRADIVRICAHLDGLPLAIELAAARINALAPATLLAMLDARMALPASLESDRPDRHRTLFGAISWSFDLLDGERQHLFGCVSLFEGGFSLQEAANLVHAQPDDATTLRVLDGLIGLVDASLLMRDGSGDEPRFRMLETVRAFGREQIAHHDQARAIQMRYAIQFLELAEASTPAMRGPERSQWLDRLDLASANLRAALTLLVEWDETELALRMASALWPYWWWRSHVLEGQKHLRDVLGLPAARDFPHLTGRCLVGCGALLETMGRYAEADDAHREAELVLERIGDKQGLAESCLFRWLVSFNAEDQAGMTDWSDRSLALFQESGDRWGIAMSLMEKGVMAMRRREHALATEWLTESMRLFRLLPDAWGVAICEGVQSNVETDRAAFGTALDLQRSSLRALLSLNDLWGVVMVMPAAVRLAMELGQMELAVRLAGATEAMSARLGTPIKEPFRERFAAAINQARAGLGSARFDLAWTEGSALGPEEAVHLAGMIPIAREKGAETPGPGPMIALSPREREVVRLIPTHSARAIGEQLFISESTVRTHIDNILAKFGARNQKELIAMLFQGTNQMT